MTTLSLVGDAGHSFARLCEWRLWWIPGEVRGQGGPSAILEVLVGGFTHLHVASGYSARYGASLPHDLVQRAAERGMTVLALTDRDTVAGSVRFAKAAAAAGSARSSAST